MRSNNNKNNIRNNIIEQNNAELQTLEGASIWVSYSCRELDFSCVE